MSNPARANTLGSFARAGFTDLERARNDVLALAEHTGNDAEFFASVFRLAADPDTALIRIRELNEHNPTLLEHLDQHDWERLLTLFGASPAFGEFFTRHPDILIHTLKKEWEPQTATSYRNELLVSVGATYSETPFAADQYAGQAGANALRVRYRQLLAEIMLADLTAGRDPDGALTVLEQVSRALSALAAAALEAALAVARTTLVETGGQGAPVPREQVELSRLGVIAMGKCGAEELNVCSDVDVIFVGETADTGRLSLEEAIAITTRLASELMRALHDPALEPPLWQVDANLRPEGRTGPLVRSLSSHLAYYDRWAETWEYQALLKARAIAGDLPLAEKYVELTRPFVWESASREDFVGTVRRMRERVTEHIREADADVQLKLGPGGLRDVEFSVQLLQLVHGQNDETLRLRGTLESLEALVAGGYVARGDGERLATAYRVLRVFEHRLQLRDLRRTEIMPVDEPGLSTLARASGLASNWSALRDRWLTVRADVRELHLKIFYAPLLSAIAALPDEELILEAEDAAARLRSLGFRDPGGAMQHLTALTKGTSRRAAIQRNLMPVLLHWFAEGADPDYGLLAFRRISEAIGESPWYLRLLRDGTETAERLTHVLAASRFAGELIERHPESVAWLESNTRLRAPREQELRDEFDAVLSRHLTLEATAERFRAIHRREILRLALGNLVGVTGSEEVAGGLDTAHTALLAGLLDAIRRDTELSKGKVFEFALIGMGRYGGRELGFSGDVDLVAVYQPSSRGDGELAAREASRIVAKLRSLVSDPRFIIDLDFDLRPEGKQGPLARSLEAYRTYYSRWAGTWEAQALLRARFVAGDAQLGESFMKLIDPLRYPNVFSESSVREIRRIKARVEAERMPKGAEPRRHLKLGPGAISDVEWCAQLLQLQHAHEHRGLRTVSTLTCLRAAVDEGLIFAEEAQQLEESWRLASDIRSAMMLWSGRGSDVLPNSRVELEGIARILGYPPRHTTKLEEDWFASTRRARVVFERRFFGVDEPAYPLR